MEEKKEAKKKESLDEIRKRKYIVLKDIVTDIDELKELMYTLKNYRYMDDFNDLEYGDFIRWIPIPKSSEEYNQNGLELTKGAFFCEFTQSIDTNTTLLQFMTPFTYSKKKYFTVSIDNCFFFQKFRS
jgi:hypothetical protein